jgi:hypothetical protein
MRTTTSFLLLIISLLFVGVTASAAPHDMPQIKSSPSLEKLKQLSGSWKGSGADMGDGTVEVQYRVSSGGSAVVETLFPGTPQEMTSIYYDEGGKLAMTHYCMLGNHPVMKLKKETPTELFFDAGEKSPLKNEPHMHTLEISFLNPNSIEQKWAMFEHGKEAHSSVFKLERVS